VTARRQWAEALAAWAIPDEILASAPASPWGFPTEFFADGARRALAERPTPTHEQIISAIPTGGVLLDVGSGAGAASLPAAPPAGRIVAVDEDPGMLEALAGLAAGRADVTPVVGRWPDVAKQAGQVDVVVCANVAYNVSDIAPFVEALTVAARNRVVLELTAVHPQSSLSPLWAHFWNLPRPTGPTAEDADAVIREVIGVTPEVRRWRRSWSYMGEPGPATAAWVRRRLCLPEDSEQEVAAQLELLAEVGPSQVVTFWWPGRAPS
jgi:hypothetical protein